MKIIEPKVKLWQQGGDAKAHIARCARVCYGRTSGNDEATIKRLIDSEHWSMFRHGTRRKSKRINKMVYGYLWC